jgi:hypothetical protein
MVDAILQQSGPLATRLLERAINVAQDSKNVPELVDRLYHNVLMPPIRSDHEPSREVDGPMPPVIEPLEDSEGAYASCFFAEQVPISIAAFVYGKGDPRVAIPVTCMIGRDADSTATTVGSWVGALHGESGLPGEWVDTVCQVNMGEIDIRGLAEELYSLPV